MPLSALDFVLAARQSEIIGLQQLLQMSKLVGAISQLIHVLQRERGTANIYLCSQGSLWGERLKERAHQVQQAVQAVDKQLLALDLAGQPMANASRLFSRIATALHSLSSLPALREQVAAQTIQQPEAMSRYSEVIRTHLALVFEAADTSGDPTVSRALLAMFSFMQGKELAGQERALAAAGFASRHFDHNAHQQLLTLIEGQERCFHTFTEFADEHSLTLWQQQQRADSSELERFRRIACTCTSPSGESNDIALRWFEITTARIDGMKLIEDRLEERLMTCCEQRICEAQRSGARQQQEIEQLPQQDSHYAALIPPQLSRSVLELIEQQSRQLQAQDAELAALRATLADRKLVERAKGLLMQHHGMSEPQAHKTLRDMAMKQNKKLAEIAEAMLSVAAVMSKSAS
ncbi:nitrate- and nitrite sensing domain-containing protein [Pseudescherichia sp.]|uniref:nitrate- and nitrite sensing domain-containing protein n=1 Tax=Pseudescherichia sp. TaxID=2055881 RepID=UPI0028A1400D|nr:nitrate- and nitrite sensing domain-containing protein [Pseudescherichia sp.]